ncbi:MAG TPA: hypothetical protein EYP85_06625 [Armatimonadetes bacterium]|nr:hypothetical protein [Armatimonadota bacterium]
MVSNLAERKRTAEVTVNLTALRRPVGRTSAENALTGQPIDLRQGAFQTELGPFTYALGRQFRGAHRRL